MLGLVNILLDQFDSPAMSVRTNGHHADLLVIAAAVVVTISGRKDQLISQGNHKHYKLRSSTSIFYAAVVVSINSCVHDIVTIMG